MQITELSVNIVSNINKAVDMMNDIVMIYDDEARAGTFLIAQGLELKHKVISDLIRKYESDFEDFSVLKKRKLRSTGGRAADEFMLDEDQFFFLGTLVRNSKVAVKFKKAIVVEFKKCRIELESLRKHQSQPKYQVTRDAGKLVRKQATDAMQEFQEYARSQGSSSPEMYYMSITKMMNGLLFIVEGKFKNLRNIMTIPQLMTVSSAEHIIDKALRDGMKNNMFYKDIFQEVKKKVMVFAELHGQSNVIDEQLKIES